MIENRTRFLAALREHADPSRAEACARYFRTGKGQYGEGDVFWGISLAPQTKLANEYYKSLDLDDLRELLQHEAHEARLTAVLMLVRQYRKAKDPQTRAGIVGFYLGTLNRVNNWDLVDSSAYQILGDWLLDKDWGLLLDLARTDHLWTQRTAIIATQAFIRKGVFEPTLAVSDILLRHPHDLIHKAVGWMIREVGKRDLEAELGFLGPRYNSMPRTMLRYAIERFPEDLRQDYLKGRV